MRIAILWQQLSGYFDACLRALDSAGHELYLVDLAPSEEAPFGQSLGDWMPRRHLWVDHLDTANLTNDLKAFEPDALLVSSWHIPEYRKLARVFSGRVPRLLCMDNWWTGTSRQWLGRITASIHIQPFYDLAFVPGIRQCQFAQMLGFAESDIITGLYCADTNAFSAEPRPEEAFFKNNAFLYVGRLVDSKGVNELLTAYREYRALSSNPWPLRVAGTGPLRDRLELIDGVEHAGFRQPDALPALMSQSTVLILPSRHEHWGVVVHEAATAGLALCCSTRVAAADRFLQEGYNGLLVAPADSKRLVSALRTFEQMKPQAMKAMSDGSLSLARQLTLSQWADHLVFRVEAHR